MTTPDRFVVTGAAGGIGRAVVERLARRGHRVLATDLDHAALEREKERGAWAAGVDVAVLDVTSAPSWHEVMARARDAWGGIDVLYNIAGYLTPGWVRDITAAEVDRHFDINTKGVVHGTCSAVQIMVGQESGHIVNIASMAALAPIPGIALYSASKYAVRAFSLAAAIELRRYGIAVTVVCPDAVATPMLDKQRDYDEAALTFSGPRVLTAEEVADTLVGSLLTTRPLEVAIPRTRKWMARVVDLAPELGLWMMPLLKRRGRATQQRSKRD
jgi:3-oxoacyl-[acyl-carrier protein] reductase